MPHVQHQLMAHGVKFRNAFVVNPICCPSRASILTGLYSHNTGVWANGGKHGGFDAFDDEATLATRLQASGYHTGLIGKYLNHYNDPSYRPPGWDSWQPMLAESEGKYYDYVINDDGTRVHYGHSPTDYSTDVLMGLGVKFLQEAPADRPFFLYLATKAPHGSATPAPRDRHAYSDAVIHFNESWGESGVDDKPLYISSRRPFNPVQQQRQTEGFLNAIRALGALDDGVGRLLQTLRSTGELDSTVVIFLSDNGTAWGEHRWGAKSVPYEETIRVPMVIMDGRQMDAAGGEVAGAMALNIDLAPTILDMAGLPEGDADGQSLVPALSDPSLPGRSSFLVEHMQLIRPEGRDDPVPSYCAVRTRSELFVRYATGEQEYYRLGSDPAELHNLAADPEHAGRIAELQAQAMRGCDPRPPDWPEGELP